MASIWTLIRAHLGKQFSRRFDCETTHIENAKLLPYAQIKDRLVSGR